MKLRIDHDEGTIDVALDDGKIVGRYCVIDNPQTERADFRRMLEAVAAEAVAAERARMLDVIERHLDADVERGNLDFMDGRMYAVVGLREAVKGVSLGLDSRQKR